MSPNTASMFIPPGACFVIAQIHNRCARSLAVPYLSGPLSHSLMVAWFSLQPRIVPSIKASGPARH